MNSKSSDNNLSPSTVCPHCKARYTGVPAIVVGKEVVCRNCKKRFIVRLDGEAKENHRKPVSREPAPTRREPRLYDPEKVPTILVDDDRNLKKAGAGPLEWGLGDVILDLYEVTGLLGQGGMGRVYKVTHLGWHVDLAVKTPTPETLAAAGGSENFEKEAETWVNLGLHPHTVSCYYVRPVKDIPCVFAEYVAGGSLHDWIIQPDGSPGRLYRGRPKRVMARILDIAIQFAYGLEYAHDQNLVHQDIKPANVMITPEGLAKVTDFGLATARPSVEQAAIITALPGQGAGTPQYFSPEQAIGRPPTPHSDLWSWGLCLLEMFKGGRSWDSGTVAGAALEEYLAAGPEEDWLPPMPDQVADLLKSCFQYDIADRPSDMKAAADRLIRAYQEITSRPYHRPRPKAGKDTANSLNNRAVSLVDLKRREEAEVLWEKVSAVQPHHLESIYNQGLLKWRRAALDDTTLLSQMAESIKTHGQDAKSTYLTTLVHLERGDYDSVIKFLETLPESHLRHREVLDVLKKAQVGLDRSTRLLTKIIEKRGSINTVFLNRKGNRAIAAGESGVIRLWDLEAGRMLTTLTGHDSVVNDLAISLDGRFMVSGGGDYSSSDFGVKFWDLNGGQVISDLKGHKKAVNGVAISIDGRVAASASDDLSVRVWGLKESRNSRILSGHKKPVNTVKINHQGTLVLSGGTDRVIKLWDMRNGRCLQTFTGHQGGVTSISYHGLKPLFISGSVDQTVRIWQVETGECLRVLTGHRDEVNTVCLSLDGRLAVSGSSDQTLKIWSVETGRCLRTLEGHSSWVLAASMNRQASLLLSGGLDSALCLWRIDQRVDPAPSPLTLAKIASSETVVSAAGQYERILKQARQALTDGRYNEAADLVRNARAQTGFERGAEAMELWRRLYPFLPRKGFQGGWEEGAFTEHTQSVECCRTGTGGTMVATGDLAGKVIIWDLESRRQIAGLEGSGAIVRAVDLSRTSEWAAVGGQDGLIHVWRIADQVHRTATINAHRKGVGGVCFSPDTRLVISCGRDHLIKTWDRDSGQLISEIKGHRTAVNALAVSRDSQRLLSGSGDYTGQDCVLRLWEHDGWCLHVMEGHQRAVNAVCMSVDGHTALSGAADGEVRVWDLAKGEAINVMRGHEGSVNAVCLSADGRFAFSGGADHSLRLWDIESGRCLRIFEGHTAPVNDIALGPGEQCLLSAGADKTVKIWTLDWEL